MDNNLAKVQWYIVDRRGMLYIEEVGEKIAVMTFQYADEQHIIVDHTHVDGTYRNMGYAKLLLHHMLQFAEENHLIIIPQCSFVKAALSRNSTESTQSNES
jgi:predicted GNAT family acetyltransferase